MPLTQAYDAPKKYSAHAVLELSRAHLRACGIPARNERFTAYLSRKWLRSEVCYKKARPFEGCSFCRETFDLGKVYLPCKEVRLSQEAALPIRHALLQGRDLQLECKPTGIYTAARHIALLLAWKIPGFAEALEEGSVAKLKASLSRRRRSRPMKSLITFFYSLLP